MNISNRGITVVSVCRDLNIEPTPELTWRVGAIVRDMYLKQYGCLPDKDLRNKTNGQGTHCFAIYPESWREKIAEVIRHHQTEKQRQGELFV
jgi:hypothetical protein